MYRAIVPETVRRNMKIKVVEGKLVLLYDTDLISEDKDMMTVLVKDISFEPFVNKMGNLVRGVKKNKW